MGKEGACHGGSGIANLCLGVGRFDLDLEGDCSTVGSRLGRSSRLLGIGSRECSPGHINSTVEVLFSLVSHTADSHEKLLFHFLAGFGRVQAKTFNLIVGTLSELANLRCDLHIECCLGLFVQFHELGLGSSHTSLTLVDGITNSCVELILVCCHQFLQFLAALGVLHCISTDDASKLVNLLLELLVVGYHSLVEAADALGEVILGLTEGILDVKFGTTSLCSKLRVCLHLLCLILGDGAVKLGGFLGEHVSGMSAVLLHGVTNIVELHHVMGSLGLLQVLLVALVANLDHSLDLGIHICVDLGLGDLVLLHCQGKLINTGIRLADLILDGGRQPVEADLEGTLSSGNTCLGLGLGSSDVLYSLGESLVVECLESVQTRCHLSGGNLNCLVGMKTICCHFSADTTELCCSFGNHNLHPVVGPLTNAFVLVSKLLHKFATASGGFGASVGNLLVVLIDSFVKVLTGLLGIFLNLCCILGNVLVGLVDAGIR